ncbi:MAG: SCO family protein [Anaerolineales bacterium]|nr:SCO family protein [Anaerolineales bacterium]
MKKLWWFLIVVVLAVSACQQAAKADEAVQPVDYQVSELRGAIFDPPRQLADFSLPSTTGDDFRLSDQRGKVVLMYFGYMACPDICPTSNTELKKVYEELGPLAEQVKVVFVTIDPERDDLARMKLYLGLFHPDFIGLRGENEVNQPIMDAFGVRAERQELSNSAMGYLLNHTASIFLVAPDGRLLEQFLYGTPYTNIAHDVRVILSGD